MLFGSMLDVVFLSIAMADRVRQERLLREAAQVRAMEMEQETRARLEQAVAERTEQLEIAMAQLRQANRRLENLSNVDDLTDVYNRRYFDQALETAWAEPQENDAPLSLLLVDADRFKEINDTFGHPAGDEVLRRMSRRIAESVSDREHVLARIGGEEFVLLLPRTGPERASEIAEMVRRDVDQMHVQFGGHLIETTVSIGVGDRRRGDRDQEVLMARADRAVSRAKENGRNRVES